MADELVVRLSFPAKPDYLLLARLALAGLARTLPAEDDVVADLKLAVTEACGNVVRHAYGDDPGDVFVSFLVRDDALEILVEDQGKGLEGKDASTGSTAAPPDGGMGMAIIRTIVDELAIDAGADDAADSGRVHERNGAQVDEQAGNVFELAERTLELGRRECVQLAACDDRCDRVLLDDQDLVHRRQITTSVDRRRSRPPRRFRRSVGDGARSRGRG